MRTGVQMYPGGIAILPYLQRLFDDPSNPASGPVYPDFAKGTFEFFGFSFLRTLLETGLETGSMQIHSDCGSVTVFLALERGEIVSARLNANPLLSMDDVLQFLLQNTPGAYRFEFVRNRAHVHQATAL